ncbi:MAG: carboxypeptidase regulatory-like domain-containing protein [Pyrinomonadaceae bacterium]
MRRTLASFVFSLCLSLVAYGQGGSGSIGGKVTDPNGQTIAGAKVTATNTDTNISADTVSTEAGDYQIIQLVPGPYLLVVEAPNFKKLERTGVTVQVADRLTIDFPLEVGAVNETVSVTAEAPLLRTQDAQTGEVIDNKQIQNLPQINRDPLQLLILAGNVQGDGSRAEGNSDTRINGGRTQGVEYLVDGIAAGQGRDHGVSSVFVPNMDAVAEFKVITNGISAEYGRLSGGAVELVSLSGSNSFTDKCLSICRKTR